MIPLTFALAGYRIEATPRKLDGQVLIEAVIFRISTEEHAILVPRATPAEARTAAHVATIQITARELHHFQRYLRLVDLIRAEDKLDNVRQLHKPPDDAA